MREFLWVFIECVSSHAPLPLRVPTLGVLPEVAQIRTLIQKTSFDEGKNYFWIR